MRKFGKHKYMSKIGKQPVIIPAGVKVEIDGHVVVVTGPKGVMKRHFAPEIGVKVEGDQVIVSAKSSSKYVMSLFGTTRALINNDVTGVFTGWNKKLELVGTGFKAEVVGEELSLVVGYSHPVKFKAPEGITFKVEKTFVTVEGIDRELVGQVAANIRSVRPPEPYKGKGIKYTDEVIRRKAGKAAAAKTGPAA